MINKIKIYKTLKQGTDEWLEVRRGKFTGFDFHHLMGSSDTGKKIIYEKAFEIITGRIEPKKTSPAMERGTELEPEARKLYIEERFDSTISEVGFIELNKDTGFSPDGLVDKVGLLEIKCPLAAVFMSHFDTKNIAPIYRTQMQLGMYIGNRLWCDYVVYHPAFKKLLIRRVIRDEEYIVKIKHALGVAIKKRDAIIASALAA